MATATDDRDQGVIEVYSDLAKALLEVNNYATRELAARQPDEAPTIATAQFKYSARIDFGGVFYTVVDVQLEGGESTFQGQGGGLSIGGGLTWGTAWFNVPLGELHGVRARFEYNLASVATNINFWRMDGAYIGSCAGGGIGLGGGVGGGEGKFS